jgi:hypothetical protein
VSEPNASEVEMATEKLTRRKPLGTNQGPAELISKGRTIRSEIHKIINSIWDEEELAQEWKETITLPIYKMGVVL